MKLDSRPNSNHGSNMNYSSQNIFLHLSQDSKFVYVSVQVNREGSNYQTRRMRQLIWFTSPKESFYATQLCSMGSDRISDFVLVF